MGIRTLPGGRFQSGSSLKQLIGHAYDVKDYQIDGGPQWLASDYFEVNASAGGDATPAEIRTMLRALLAERFALRVHNATREAPTHVLTLVRPDGQLGPRLTRTTPECLRQIENRQKGGRRTAICATRFARRLSHKADVWPNDDDGALERGRPHGCSVEWS
jgi:uncharacterized protein (TIGR03435 family)